MKIAIIHSKIGPDATEVYAAWDRATKRQGDQPVHCYSYGDFTRQPSDVAIMVSYPQFMQPRRLLGEFDFLDRDSGFRPNPINNLRTEVLNESNKTNRRIIFIDSGILKCNRERNGNKDNHYQVGYDCIKGMGQYYNSDVPDDRLKKLNIEIKPWRSNNGTCLIFGQLRFGVGSQHIDIHSWYRYSLRYLKERDVRCLYLEHPNVGEPFTHEKYRPKNIERDQKYSEKTGWTLSFSSNASVEAIIEGIPSICVSQLSPAYNVCTNKIEEYKQIKTFDREEWLRRLTYTQWNIHEMDSGECWNHLRQHATKQPERKYPEC